jgi:iron complex outermembrane receptor protein
VVDQIVGGVNYGRIDLDANFTELSVELYRCEEGSIGPTNAKITMGTLT